MTQSLGLHFLHSQRTGVGDEHQDIERRGTHHKASSRSGMSNARCDSSDCLECQGDAGCSRHHMEHQSHPRGLSDEPSALAALLRKRHLQQEAEVAGGHLLHQQPGGSACEAECRTHSGRCGRRRYASYPCSADGGGRNASSGGGVNAGGSPLSPPACGGGGGALSLDAWKYQQEFCSSFAAADTPAPACFVDLASLGRPPQAPSPRHDFICAIEFSPCGKYLAAGSIAKQVRLYSVAECLPTTITACGPRCSAPPSSPPPVGPPPATTLRTASKVSSLAWAPGLEGVVTTGDYDGVLTQLHLGTGHVLADVEAHGGKRIWSVAHSPLVHGLAASASEDGTAHLWGGTNLSQSAGVLRPPTGRGAAICCVDFSAADAHLVAIGSADHCVYVYDMRAAALPLLRLQHHRRAVSYVKWFGSHGLVSSSTDGTIAVCDVALACGLGGGGGGGADAPTVSAQASVPCCYMGGGRGGGGGRRRSAAERWSSCSGRGVAGNDASTSSSSSMDASCGGENGEDEEEEEMLARLRLANSSGGGAPPARAAPQCPPSAAPSRTASLSPLPYRTFAGHRNEKNFVGLAVRADAGLVASGSEGSGVYTYHTAWSSPLANWDAPVVAWEPAGSGSSAGRGACCVSAVCWQPAVLGAPELPPVLATASSEGDIHLLALVRPRRGGFGGGR